MTPQQFTTFDGSLVGPVDGLNKRFTWTPYPAVLQYSTPGVTGTLFFKNGLLVDEYADYTQGPGYFVLPAAVGSDIFVARFFQGGGASKMRLSGGGLTARGSLSLWLSPQGPSATTSIPLMLFRNGQLLTQNSDYTKNGPWITLITNQAIQDGDSFIALIGMGGTEASTVDGLITGAVNGINNVFGIPVSSQLLLFRNGQLLTETLDYYRQGASQVVLNPPQVPQAGDALTAQVWASGGPIQVTNYGGGLFFSTAQESLLFLDGLLETQPRDGVTSGDTATLTTPPLTGSTVTVEVWTPDITDATQPAMNLSRQYSTADGSLIGVVDGVNRQFTIPYDGLITDVLLFWNGIFQVQGTDFQWSISASGTGPSTGLVSMTAAAAPTVGDTVTSEVWVE